MKSSSEKSKPFIVATRHDLALAMSAMVTKNGNTPQQWKL